MQKGVTKEKICVSIDRELYKEMKEYCEKRMIKFSTYLAHCARKGHDKKE